MPFHSDSETVAGGAARTHDYQAMRKRVIVNALIIDKLTEYSTGNPRNLAVRYLADSLI